MSLESKKPRIFITGHTRGIGKAIFDLYEDKNFFCYGVSKSTGMDIDKDCDLIVEQMANFNYIVLNAYEKDSQLRMLKSIVERYQDEPKKIVVITSTSGTPAGMDSSLKQQEYNWYCKNKKSLIEYIEKIQQDLYEKPIQIFDVCPDTVKTDMSHGLWEEYPKLHAQEVAECVDMCFTKPYNINKIVLQKYAS
jgi:NAD(P)-dependent dehydrogenase (short-subunit alcohol dehydrogenase family)|tara:strand:- start:5235 stop:5813 length:579 start_codon:yes stop_codon:yes gene_type:complete